LEPALVILLITVGLAIVSKVLQRKLVDQKKMREFQSKVKEDQKRFNLLLKEVEKNKKEIEELQSQIMKQQMEMMNANMKLSLFTMPAFLIAFWFLSSMYTGQTLTSFVVLPTFNGFNILNPVSWIPIGLSTSTGFYKMFFFYYFVSAIIVGRIEWGYDKYIKKN
jgi:uncharacterized membrane protein (DUF106 family)